MWKWAKSLKWMRRWTNKQANESAIILSSRNIWVEALKFFYCNLNVWCDECTRLTGICRGTKRAAAHMYKCACVCVAYAKFYIYVLCGFKTFKGFYVCLKCFSTPSISLKCVHLGNFRHVCLYLRMCAVYTPCESS